MSRLCPVYTLLSVLFCFTAMGQEHARWQPSPAPPVSTALTDGFLWAKGVQLAEDNRPAEARPTPPVRPYYGPLGVSPDYYANARLQAANSAVELRKLQVKVRMLEEKVEDKEREIAMHMKFIKRIREASKPRELETPASAEEWKVGWEKKMEALLDRPSAQTAQDVIDWVFVGREKDNRPKMAVISLEN